MGGNTYCPACSGHGTNVHECAELRSAVMPETTIKAVVTALWDCFDDYLEGREMSADRNVQVVDALALVEEYWPSKNG